MAIITETRHPGEHVLSEANGTLSREQVTIKSGAGVLAAGTLLGVITAESKYVAFNIAGTDDGRRTAVGVLYAQVDATSGDVPAVMHTRLCEVNGAELTGLTDTGKGHLLTRNVVVR